MSEQSDLPSTLRDLEAIWGLTEVVMVRLPSSEWASAQEVAALEAICALNPLPDDWPYQMSRIARTSLGFQQWLRQVSRGEWKAPLEVPDLVRVNQKLAQIDFALPWCARLRWGARLARSVDVFLCATGRAGGVMWESFTR